MKNISILGAGKAGTSLGRALVEAGYTLVSLSCSTLAEAEESHRIIGQGEPSKNNIHAAQNAEILFITVPDDSIKDIVRELDFSDILWRGKTVYHSSGLLTSEILHSLRIKGASTASFHPIQSFSNKYAGPNLFKNVYFGLEGEEDAVTLAKKIVHALGGHSIEISPGDKPILHAAFSMTSNFFVVLLDSAAALLKSSGLSEEKAIQILHPLLEGTLSNIVGNGIRSALTGPIIRRDVQTVKSHLDALKKFPGIEDVYRTLAKRTLDMAFDEKKLPEEKIKKLIQILEDK